MITFCRVAAPPHGHLLEGFRNFDTLKKTGKIVKPLILYKKVYLTLLQNLV